MAIKSIDAVFKFGHLYDRQTGKRILIEDGAEASIVLQSEHLLEADPSIALNDKPKSSSELELEIKSKHSGTAYWLMLEAKSSLYFRISGFVPKRNHKQPFALEFRMELLEDLYIYNLHKNRPEMAQLYPCKCAILECLTKNFDFFEPVYGDSVNKARTKLHELYFSRVVNPASNAFKTFFTQPQYKDSYFSLDALRLEVQRARK